MTPDVPAAEPRGELASWEAPPHDCQLCPRLAAYREANRQANPGWFNGPVPSFGPRDARVLVVGMAPGVKGANRTGRPFTGDHAGILLYRTLIDAGLARGTYLAEPDDGITLQDCRIVNAVRCVPPANLPESGEVATCNRFLVHELAAMAELRIMLALAAVLRACGLSPSRVKFSHGAVHALPDGLLLADSYHVSRYNTSTGRLTAEMFAAVVRELVRRLASEAPALGVTP